MSEGRHTSVGNTGSGAQTKLLTKSETKRKLHLKSLQTRKAQKHQPQPAMVAAAHTELTRHAAAHSDKYTNAKTIKKKAWTHLERWHSFPLPSSRCPPSHPRPSLPKLPRPSPFLHPRAQPLAQKLHHPLLVQHLPHLLLLHSRVFSETS